MKHITRSMAGLLLALAAGAAFAQATPAAPVPWTYQTRQLDRAAVDALLAQPEKLLVLDVRRPDELVAKGGFPVYLNIQAADIDKHLAYIPRDRVILTVSNHAHRAGAVGDKLTAKGYTLAGAAGSEDYEAQGGKAVVRLKARERPASAAR